MPGSRRVRIGARGGRGAVALVDLVAPGVPARDVGPGEELDPRPIAQELDDPLAYGGRLLGMAAARREDDLALRLGQERKRPPACVGRRSRQGLIGRCSLAPLALAARHAGADRLDHLALRVRCVVAG